MPAQPGSIPIGDGSIQSGQADASFIPNCLCESQDLCSDFPRDVLRWCSCGRLSMAIPDFEPDGPQWMALIAICRAANDAGHRDELVVAAARRMHWRLQWAQRYHQGKEVRGLRAAIVAGRTGDVAKVSKRSNITIAAVRRHKPVDDVRRMRDHLWNKDIVGFAKAWTETSRYLQELVMGSAWAIESGTKLFRPHAPFGPKDYALIGKALDRLLASKALRVKPRMTELDALARLLSSLFEWLTGRKHRGANWNAIQSAPAGPLHRFALAISKAYGLAIVTERSADRLRGTRRTAKKPG